MGLLGFTHFVSKALAAFYSALFFQEYLVINKPQKMRDSVSLCSKEEACLLFNVIHLMMSSSYRPI